MREPLLAERTQTTRGTNRWVWGATAALAVCLAYLAAVVPLILRDVKRPRPEWDQNAFHRPAIERFARQWPRFDFSDYSAATTPGYHLAIAGVQKFVTGNLHGLKLAGACFALGLLATLSAAVARRAGAVAAIAVSLPLACSIYTVSAGVWLLPDNAGWFFTLLALLVALRSRVDRFTWVAGAVLVALVAAVRQSHLWVFVTLAAAILDESRGKELSRRAAALAAMALPAAALMGWFVVQWRGLTPPSQRPILGGYNLAGPTMAFCVVGVLGTFFLPLFLPQAPTGRRWRVSAKGALLGFLVGALPITTYSNTHGRFGGLWNAAAHCPTFAHRSPVIIALATLGGAVGAIWLASLPRRQRFIWGWTAAAFALAQIGTNCAFQRYDEPLVLIAFALAARDLPQPIPRRRLLGPLLLCLFLAGVTVMSL